MVVIYPIPAASHWWVNRNGNTKMETNFALIGCLFGLALTEPVLIAEEHQHVAVPKEAHDDHVIEGYAAIGTALHEDDLTAAKKAAVGLIRHRTDSAIETYCQAIAISKTLEKARTHFKAFSDAIIPIAKEDALMHVAHCPMAAGGKGASWLQKSADEVQNPYMGSKMPHCGKLVK